MGCLLRWKNNEIRVMAGVPVITCVMAPRNQWFGRVIRRPNFSKPSRRPSGSRPTGKRPYGRPKMDQMATDIGRGENFKYRVHNRGAWKAAVGGDDKLSESCDAGQKEKA